MMSLHQSICFRNKTSIFLNTKKCPLYAHLLNRKISKQTLMSQRLTKIYTKNEKTEIMFLNNYGDVILNNMSNLVKENINLQNGIIHEIDRLLLPVF